MAKVESLGIKRLESVHYYVHDLERSRRFYTEVMDFAEIGESSEELTRDGPAEVGRVPGGQLRGGVHHPARRGRARRALAAQVPRRRRHAQLRGRGRGEDVPPARGPRRDADRRRAARQGRARQRDRLVLDHDALRRHHLPLHRAPRLPRDLPGLRDARQAERRDAIGSASSASTTPPRTSRRSGTCRSGSST